jgi:hypothetical protein
MDGGWRVYWGRVVEPPRADRPPRGACTRVTRPSTGCPMGRAAGCQPAPHSGAAATGRWEARWDRPSPFVVYHALPSRVSLTDDKNRSSVLPNRRKVRWFAGVMVHSGAAATGRRDAEWDRPSPFVVYHALPSRVSLTDDKNRSSVLPNRRKVRWFAGVMVHSGAAATGRWEARWDRPSPVVVYHALPSRVSLTDDKNRSSVLPDRRKVRWFAGVMVHSGAAATGRWEARWDRPSPFVVCHALPSRVSLTDDKNRSSVLPNRGKARGVAEVVVISTRGTA